MLLREMEVGSPVLVAVPLSTLPNWVSEYRFWAPRTNVVVLHGNADARQVVREHELYGHHQDRK
eukprot:8918837-Pyramimonas_sp.AAC.2